MKFYTTAKLFQNKILHQGYKDGRRFREKVPYKPYLFVDSRKASDTKYKNIKGQPVERIDFDSIGDQRDFTRKYKGIDNFDIYGITNHAYLFLNDEYPGESCDYDPSLIRVVNIDIEVAADEGFPDIEVASKPITAITMKMGDDIACFGCGEFNNTDPRVTYYKARDEMELLRDYIRVWREWDPDVCTGWNIEGFDIPYILNRVTNVLNFDAARELSPFGIIDDRNFMNDGNSRQDIVGVALYDYLSLYRKFTYTQQESYSLDNISSVELGEKKLDYSEYDGLFSLYKNDYQKFMEYNIKDVELVDRLEKKLGLIELGFAIAYDAKVNLIDCYTSVRMWDIIIHNYLLAKGVVVPSYTDHDKERQVEGAYVKDPQTGMHNWVVSFDLNSLYPHLIMQYNIGPDTYHSHLPTKLGVQEIIDGKLDEPEYRKYVSTES